MAAATAAAASTMSLLPISQLRQQQHGTGAVVVFRRRPRDARRRRYVVPTARLFGPAIFEASKLKVLFLGVDEESNNKHGHPTTPSPTSPPLPVLPRTYTLTHSDVTASLTLAVSHTINRAQLQGWYNRLQRDEVVAEWKKVRGRMSLHVHCHISGGHFLLDLIAGLRYYIFRKELPVVLKAFVHGDGDLFSRHPELEDATVWVYFHSNLTRFNRVECWGPLRDAAAPPAEEEPSKLVSTSGTAASSSAAGGRDSADPEAKRLKQMTPSENNDRRTEAGSNSGNASKSADKKPAPKEPPKDYIHVRARRGQATDSHSLAERARREKISERMKALQDIVPGCNKVIGKASVLDEIINYIQSLQCQVEFLSMKLEAINAHMNNATVAFPTKDFGAPPYNTAPSLTLDPQTPREYAQGSMSDWLHMQIGNAYERVT